MMKKDLAANHPNIKLVDVVYGNDDDQTSFDKTAALLQPHPNLKGIISPDHGRHRRGGSLPVDLGRTRARSQLTGLGTPNQMRDYVKDGTVKDVRAVEPGRPGLPRRLRGQGAGRRHHHRQGG